MDRCWLLGGVTAAWVALMLMFTTLPVAAAVVCAVAVGAAVCGMVRVSTHHTDHHRTRNPRT